MATITVGPGRDYLTVTAAVNASVSNDTVLIDPGVYNELITLPQRSVHLLGRTVDPENNTVYLRGVHLASFSSSNPITYIFEKIYFYVHENITASTRNFYLSGCTNITFIVNRCKLHCTDTAPSTSIMYVLFYMTNCVKCQGYVLNCDFFCDVTGGIRYDIYQDGSTSCYLAVIKSRFTYLDRYTGRYNPNVDDAILGSAPGYGTGYGSAFLNLPKTYMFSGKVRTMGNPSSNVIRAYRDYDHLYEGHTLSDAVTGNYSLYTTYSGTHQLICESVSDPLFDDKIISNLVPALTTPTTIWDELNSLYATISGSLLSSDIYSLPVFIYFKEGSGTNLFDTSIVLDNLSTYNLRKRWSVWSSQTPYQLYVEILNWSPETGDGCAVVRLPYVSATQDTQLTIRYDRTVSDNTSFVFDTEGPYVYPLYALSYLGSWSFNQSPTTGSLVLIDSTVNLKHGSPVGTFYASDLVDSPTGKAWQFSGSNHATIPDTNLLGYNPAYWSILVGFSLNTTSGVQTIHTVGHPGGGFELGVDNGVLYATAKQNLTAIETLCSGINSDTWYNAAVVCDKDTDTMSLYLDGNLASSVNHGIFDTNFLVSDTACVAVSEYNYHYLPTLPEPTLPSGTVLYVSCSGVEGYPYIHDALGLTSFTKIEFTGIKGYITTSTSRCGDASYYYGGKEHFKGVTDSRFNVGSQKFSVSAWFNFSYWANSNYPALFEITGTSESPNPYSDGLAKIQFFIWYATNRVYVRPRTDAGTLINNFVFDPVRINCWEHYGFYRDGDVFYIRRNGIVTFSYIYNTVDLNWSGKYIRIGHNAADMWRGYIDSFVITIGDLYEPTPQELGAYQTYLNGKVDYIQHVGRALSPSEAKIQGMSYKNNLFTFSS